jgi:hypothetical protein
MTTSIESDTKTSQQQHHPHQEHVPKSLLHNALGSATAGIISRTFTHPLDTVRGNVLKIHVVLNQKHHDFVGAVQMMYCVDIHGMG